MGYGLGARRSAILVLIFACIFISTIADEYVMWILFSAVSVILLMVDLMFLGQNHFIYDPDYKNWETMTQSQY